VDAIDKIGCSMEQLRSAVKVWKSHSLLDIIGDYIVSLDQISKDRLDQILASGAGATVYIEESSNEDEKVSEIWPMVEGMLTNLGPSDAGTIHRTLSMFMSDFSYDLKQFQKLLDQMAIQDKLEVDGQIYKIKKA
jgi:Anaphase promoting complex (APC) subunit 2